MTRRRVVVTGIGLLSPLGTSPSELHAALLSGASALKEITLFDTERLRVRRGGEVEFDPGDFLGRANFRPIDRTGRLSIVATHLALAESGWDEESRAGRELCLVLGTTFGSVRTIAEFDRRAVEAGPKYAKPFEFANSVINAAAGQTAIWFGLRGTNSTVAGGAAASLKALAYASDMVRSGRADVVLAGGAEELCFESFYGYHQAGLLAGAPHPHSAPGRPSPQGERGAEEPCSIPFAAARNGFSLGEGAVLFVLEEAEAAAARGATVLAEVLGHASAFDPSRGADAESAAAAIERTVTLALADAGCEAASIDALSVGASGSVAGDRQEAAGLARALGGRAAEVAVLAVKGQLGESLGASGALQTVALLESMRHGEAPGIAGLDVVEEGLPLASVTSENRRLDMRRGLVHASSFDGSACALVIERT